MKVSCTTMIQVKKMSKAVDTPKIDRLPTSKEGNYTAVASFMPKTADIMYLQALLYHVQVLNDMAQ